MHESLLTLEINCENIIRTILFRKRNPLILRTSFDLECTFTEFWEQTREKRTVVFYLNIHSSLSSYRCDVIVYYIRFLSVSGLLYQTIAVSLQSFIRMNGFT